MPAQHPRLTVQDLLSEPELGLTLVAGKRGAERPVGGVHVSEMADPTPWLAPRDVLLTTGLALTGDAQLQRDYIHRLSEAGIAALGYAAGITEEGAPEPMREAAEETGLALFEVGYEIPFRTVTSYIFTSLLSTDMHRLRRSLSVQNHLLSLMVEEKGADHLVSSLSMLLSATIILFDATGSATSLAPHRVRIDQQQSDRIWRTYASAARAGDLSRETTSGDLRLVFREIRMHGRVHSVLALVIPAREHVTELADIVLTYAQKLLSLDLLKSRDTILLQRKLRSDLLDELASENGDAADLAARLRAHQIEPDRPLRVLFFDFVRPAGAQRGRTQRTPEQIEEARSGSQDVAEAALADLGFPALTMARGDTLTVLFQPGRLTEERLRDAGDGLQADLERGAGKMTVRAGLSDPFTGTTSVARGCAQAREAARLAGSAGRSGLILFGDLGPGIRALENQGAEQLRLFFESTIGPLEGHDQAQNDQLVHSLEVYLEEQRSVSQAARRLYVHQNTMRYRLKKIETLLGVDLGDTETLVDLYLGLRARVILRSRGVSG